MIFSFLERCLLPGSLLHMQEMLIIAQLYVWCKWDDAQRSWTILLSFVSVHWAKEISRVLEWGTFSRRFPEVYLCWRGLPLVCRPSACQPPDEKICPLSWCQFTPPSPKAYAFFTCLITGLMELWMPWQSCSFGFFFHWFLVLDKDYRLSRLHRLLELSYLLCDLSL